MQPPLCRSCGKREWNHTCAGAVDKTAGPVREDIDPDKPAKLKSRKAKIAIRDAVAVSAETAKPKRGRPRTGFDRKAYVRNYMQERRKRQKEDKP